MKTNNIKILTIAKTINNIDDITKYCRKAPSFSCGDIRQYLVKAKEV